MSVLNVFQKRRSVRGYEAKPIPADVWASILEAGRIAATSRGRQARRFITITDPKQISETVREAKMQEFLVDASALLVGCTSDAQSSGADVIISMTQMETMAVSLGLGTLWLGVFDREVMSQRINLPDGYKVVLMMAFGYPAEDGKQPPKLPLEELFAENQF